MIEFKEVSESEGKKAKRNLPAKVKNGATGDAEVSTVETYGGGLIGKLSATGWEAPRGVVLSYDDWRDEGQRLHSLHVSALFAVGDWLNYGEKTYAEMYAQAASETGYSPEFLKKVKYVAKRIPRSKRVEALGFGHHAAVASLDEKTQAAFLTVAQIEGWGVRETEKAISEAKASGEVETELKGKKGGRPKRNADEPQEDGAKDKISFGSASLGEETEEPSSEEYEDEAVEETSVDGITAAVGQFYDQLIVLGGLINNWRAPALAEEIKRHSDVDEHRDVINEIHSALYTMLQVIDA